MGADSRRWCQSRRCATRRTNELNYRWSKEFLEAGKKRLAGDTAALSEQIYTDAIGF